jgi:hypothetical protein
MMRPDKQINRRQCLVGLAAATAAALTPRLCLSERDRAIVRMAISVETLIGANINDARAAYRVWIDKAFHQNAQANVEFDPEIFVPSEQILREVRGGAIDCYGVNALEFARVADLTDPDHLILLSYLADGIDYVLLVHKNSPFKKIEDLKGAQIATHLNHDMVLLPAWLDTMLASKNLPESSRFFASITPYEKLTQVVLPVFFRRIDGACLARRNWETAVELNPQLGRDLWPIAVSPRVIPCAIGIRRGCNPGAIRQFIDSLLRVSKQPEGQQILALYQANGFELRPTSAMNSTLEMVRLHERITAAARKGKL